MDKSTGTERVSLSQRWAKKLGPALQKSKSVVRVCGNSLSRKITKNTIQAQDVSHRRPAKLSSTSYRYSSINSEKHDIRLVHLRPRRKDGDVIRCSIVTANLDSSLVDFDALSYEWGPTQPELQISIDGTIVSIQENLWWALHHLRYEDKIRVLWIDALCINQSDVAERNAQVSQMGNIYSSCKQCIAWLGCESSSHGGRFEDCEMSFKFIESRKFIVGATRDLSNLEGDRKIEHDAFESLCRQKYWSRLWIIQMIIKLIFKMQEIILSPVVVVKYGLHEAQFETLTKIFKNLSIVMHPSYRFSARSSVPFLLSQYTRGRILYRQKNPSRAQLWNICPLLGELVLQFKDARCEDPRDTVYGLLGLTRQCCFKAVPADYSISAQEVCNNLLVHHISKHQDETMSDVSPDIQEICEIIIFRPKEGSKSKKADASIASASMKAISKGGHNGEALSHIQQAGRVVWVVPVARMVQAKHEQMQVVHGQATNKPLSDVITCFLNGYRGTLKNLSTKEDSQESKTFPIAVLSMVHFPTRRSRIVPPRLQPSTSSSIPPKDHVFLTSTKSDNPSLLSFSNTEPKATISNDISTTSKHKNTLQPHIFLTDRGFAGIASSSVKLGVPAYRVSSGDLRTNSASGDKEYAKLFKSSGKGLGIFLESVKVQDMISWLC